MLAKFIGENGSMDLVHGKTYKIEIGTGMRDGYVWVFWHDPIKKRRISCPYSSIKKLSENWE